VLIHIARGDIARLVGTGQVIKLCKTRRLASLDKDTNDQS
jgi:hypothetical protein